MLISSLKQKMQDDSDQTPLHLHDWAGVRPKQPIDHCRRHQPSNTKLCDPGHEGLLTLCAAQCWSLGHASRHQKPSLRNTPLPFFDGIIVVNFVAVIDGITVIIAVLGSF